MAEIISLGPARHLKEIARAKVQAEIDAQCAAVTQKARAEILEHFDKIRELIAQGRLDGIIVIGRDPETKVFLNDVLCVEPFDVNEAFAYVGILDTLKLEFNDMAMEAPVMMSDGSYAGPDGDMP